MGPLEQVLNRNKDLENAKYLTIIQNNTKRLLSLVDQLITFRKAEQGHLNLKLSIDTLGYFIYPATEVFADYAIKQNVNFFYKISSPNEQVVIDVEKTEKIIFNCCQTCSAIRRHMVTLVSKRMFLFRMSKK